MATSPSHASPTTITAPFGNGMLAVLQPQGIQEGGNVNRFGMEFQITRLGLDEVALGLDGFDKLAC